jgi:hypothetical protein
VDPLRRNLDTEQPSGACASEPPDGDLGAYADYVERLEDRIAGRTAPREAPPANPEATADAPGDSRP